MRNGRGRCAVWAAAVPLAAVISLVGCRAGPSAAAPAPAVREGYTGGVARLAALGTPGPVIGDGYTITLTRVSATRALDLSRQTERITVGIALELDRPDIASAGPSSYPKMVLHTVHDEHGRAIPIKDDEPQGPPIKGPDLRQTMLLIGSMDSAPPRTVGVGGGGVTGFDHVPRWLRLVAGTVEFDQVASFRTIEVPLEVIMTSTEVEPGLWLHARVAAPRPGEVRVNVTHTVINRTDDPEAIPPLPATIDLLDHHGAVVGRLMTGGSRATADRVLTDAQFVGYLPPERRPWALRIALADKIERVRLPFEFRDVPLTLPPKSETRAGAAVSPAACPG